MLGHDGNGCAGRPGSGKVPWVLVVALLRVVAERQQHADRRYLDGAPGTTTGAGRVGAGGRDILAYRPLLLGQRGAPLTPSACLLHTWRYAELSYQCCRYETAMLPMDIFEDLGVILVRIERQGTVPESRAHRSSAPGLTLL